MSARTVDTLGVDRKFHIGDKVLLTTYPLRPLPAQVICCLWQQDSTTSHDPHQRYIVVAKGGVMMNVPETKIIPQE